MSRKARFWSIGIVVIIIGLILARVIAPGYADQGLLQLVFYLAGVVFAMAGLGVILFGIRKP